MLYASIRKNKRNITGGEIHLNHVDQADKIDEDATQDYDDSLLSVLDMEPEITKIFIENLKDGEFIEINQNALRRRIQMMEEQNKKTAQSEDVLLVLNQLIHDVIKLVDRFIFFFQGLVSGMAIMHLVIIYLDQDLISTFKYYSKTALRIDQVFHIMLMISCFGSLFVAMQLQEQANKTKRSVDRKLYIQSILTSICYSISYLAWIVAHQGISQAASSLPLAIDNTAATDQIYVKYDANYSDLEQWINIWKVLQIVITGVALLFNSSLRYLDGVFQSQQLSLTSISQHRYKQSIYLHQPKGSREYSQTNMNIIMINLAQQLLYIQCKSHNL